jgi:excinuclease ABC subunit C
MVVLENGEAAKAQYRSFNIKKAKEADDIAATREVLSRRFEHTEWPFPNLVVIDGGEVHLLHTAPLVKKVAPNAKIVSVVKDEHHKAREILVYQNETVLTKQEENQILLANSEAHRFSKRLMNEKQKIKRLVVKGK